MFKAGRITISSTFHQNPLIRGVSLHQVAEDEVIETSSVKWTALGSSQLDHLGRHLPWRKADQSKASPFRPHPFPTEPQTLPGLLS